MGSLSYGSNRLYKVLISFQLKSTREIRLKWGRKISQCMTTCSWVLTTQVNHYSDSDNINPWTNLRLGKSRFMDARMIWISRWISSLLWALTQFERLSPIWAYNPLRVSFIVWASNPLRCPPIPMSSMVGAQTQLRHESLESHLIAYSYKHIKWGCTPSRVKHIEYMINSIKYD